VRRCGYRTQLPWRWYGSAVAYDSGLITKDSKKATTVNADVTGKDVMDIVVTDGRDGMYGDHVAWAGARLVK
jgi:hypothetical protein